MRYALPLIALLSSGCVLNAVFEVDMQLPYDATTDDRPFALVEVMRGRIPVDFDPDFPITAGESFRIAEPIDLCIDDPETVCNLRFSVLSENIELEALTIRINLCRSFDCNGDSADARAPYYLFEVEQPFYPQQRTRWSPSQAPFAAAIMLDQPQPSVDSEERRYEADRCEVEGCSDGNAIDDPVFGWCLEDRTPGCMGAECRGAHFCDE